MQLFLLAMLVLLVYPMLVVVQKLVPKKDVTCDICVHKTTSVPHRGGILFSL